MSRGYLLIDGSHITHAANAATALSVGGQPTQAIYGFLRTLRSMVSVYSMLTPLVLWDGASWRKLHFPEYKAQRVKEAVSKSDEAQQKAREEAKQQIPFIRRAVGHLGVRQMLAINYEADDLAGMLVARYAKTDKKIVMISGDKDWIQLLRPNCVWVDPVRDHRLTSKNLSENLGYNPNKGRFDVCKGVDVEGFIGVPTPQAWLEIKAMMGDVSDNIPGVGGIGPRGAIDLVTAYGSVGSFFNQIADKSLDPKSLPKKLRDFAEMDEKHDIFRRNMQLMDLMTHERPEMINPKITSQPINFTGFEQLCRELAFNRIVNDMDTWLEPFTTKMEKVA